MLARCANHWQAEQVAKQHIPDPQPELDDPPVSGEGRYVIRVLPKHGEWWVERWDHEALMWEAEDEADVPF